LRAIDVSSAPRAGAANFVFCILIPSRARHPAEGDWGAIEKIERYVAGLDRDTFIKDDKTIDSVVHKLEIIGEAANRLPKNFRA
jgi:hypothetical protein